MFSTPSTSHGFFGFSPRAVATASGDASSTSSTPSNSDSAIPSIEFGELVELPSSNDIMKTLECPVCKGISYPPIFNCINGHSVCGTCRPKLAHCVLCKANYTESRNFSLESLVHNSKFHCHYKGNGCNAVISGENYKEHLRACLCRPGAKASHQWRHSQRQTWGGTSPTANSNNGGGDDDDDEEDTEDDLSFYFAEMNFEDFEVVSWIKCKTGHYPSDDLNPVIAGWSAGCPVFVARAYQGSRLIMGRLIPTEKAAYIYWNGCQKKWYYEVLVAVPDTIEWVDASWGDVPHNAISGGQSPDLENVYIGRALHNGQYVPGYVQPSCQGCYIGVGRQLYLCHDYQALVAIVN